MFNTSKYLLLFCFLSAALVCCHPRNEKDPLAVADSLQNDNRYWFGVTVKVFYYSPTSMRVSSELSNSRGVIFSDSTKMFVNGIEMHYSVGTGNYYEKYPSYSLEFENKKIPKDTLLFSVQLRDSKKYKVGYVRVQKLIPMVNDANLSRELEHDKTKPLIIDWGGTADSLVLYRSYFSFIDSVKTFSGGPYDPSTLFHRWNHKKSITVKPDYFLADSVTVYDLYLTWIKSVPGKITNPNIYGTIEAKCEVNQKVILEKIEF